jgi:hypothetical protein
MGKMKTKINELRALANSADINNLLTSAHAIAHSYEHNNLDEGDIYNLLRDVLSVTTTVQALQEEFNTIA